jgi:thymidylate synthase (FAD)
MIKATYVDHMGSDLSVVNAARVSFGKKSEALGTVTVNGHTRQSLHYSDTKLINYLAKHKHISPFGHAFVSFHVKAPVFVARQLVKHKFLRWNEISRRYVSDEPEFYVPDNWREKANDKKQGSGSGFVNELLCDDTEEYPDDKAYLADYWEINTSSCVEYNVYSNALAIYEELLKNNVCPEQARMVLPQSTMTEWYWSGSLDAFADMCNLRLKTDTQYETQLVAQEIDQIMLGLFPVSWEALVYGDDE